ncbi:MAG: hypothetical protein GF390_01330 [Candidatus Pacebacteria bacterium]|nr:hypothetical protein [Candidatus Paceibacterota bacterium]
MAKIQAPNDLKEMPLAVVKNMVTLATSGFGLVVALAWNEVIKTAVAQYVEPLLGKDSGLISLFIYALAMTFLAVFVTMQLASLEKKFTQLNARLKNNGGNN